MRVLVLADPQIAASHEFSAQTPDGLTSHLQAVLETSVWLKDLIRSLEGSLDLVCHVGDHVEQKGVFTEPVLYVADRFYRDVSGAAAAIGVPYRQLLGNHDYATALLRDRALPFISRDEFVSATMVEEFGDEEVVFLPDGPIESLPFPPATAKLVLGHAQIRGAWFSPFFHKNEEQGLTGDEILTKILGSDVEKLGRPAMLINGHYHHPRQEGRVLCPGSLIARTFDDRLGQSEFRGVVVVDSATMEVDWYENPHSPIFRDIRLDQGDYSETAPSKELERTYVRIYYGTGQETEASTLRDLYAGARLVPVIESVSEMTGEVEKINDDELFDEYLKAESPVFLADTIQGMRSQVLVSEECSVHRNIKITSIDIQNFAVLGSVEFVPVPGIHQILGRFEVPGSQSSNGAGKSSLFEALQWCLYGESLKGKGDEVINDFAEYCRVVVVLSINDVEYTIVRSRKDPEYGTGVVVWCGDVSEPVSPKDIRDSNKYLVELLGMDAATFYQVVLLRDDLTGKFMLLSYADRQRLIEEVFNVGYLDTAAKRAADLARQAVKALAEAKARYHEAERTRDQLYRDLESLRDPDPDRIQELTDDIQMYSEKLELREQKRAVTVTKRKEIETALAAVSAEIEKIRGHRQQLLKARTVAQTQIAEVEQRKSRTMATASDQGCPACGQPFDEDMAKDYCKRLEAEIVGVRTHLEELDGFAVIEDKAHREATEQETLLKDKYRAWTTESDKYENQRRDIEKLQGEALVERATLESAAAEVDKQRVRINGSLDEKEGELQLIEIDVEEAQQTSDASDWWSKALATDGIRRRLVESRISYMNTWIEQYVDQIWDKGKVRIESVRGSKIGVKVGTRPYERHSRGERNRVDILLQMLLNHLYRVSRGLEVDLVVFDEILDTGVDSSGLQVLVELIKETLDTQAVYITSHNLILQGMIEDTMTMVFNGKQSRLEGE